MTKTQAKRRLKNFKGRQHSPFTAKDASRARAIKKAMNPGRKRR